MILSITLLAPLIKVDQRFLRPLFCGSSGDRCCCWREEEEEEEVSRRGGSGGVAAAEEVEAVRCAASAVSRGVVALWSSPNSSSLYSCSSSEETSRPASCRENFGVVSERGTRRN